MNIGDHLVSSRTGYDHHGIYVGNQEVIHYSGFSGGMSSGVISKISVKEFTKGNDVSIKNHIIRMYTSEESVNRAYSRLGEDWYDPLFNNCEHFVTWCIVGIHSSSQVNKSITGTSIASIKLENTSKLFDIINFVIRHLTQEKTKHRIVEISNSDITKSPVSDYVAKTAIKSVTNYSIGAVSKDVIAKGLTATAEGAIAGGATATGLTAGLTATAGGAIATSLTVTAGAPIIATIAVAGAVGYGIKKSIDWFRN